MTLSKQATTELQQLKEQLSNPGQTSETIEVRVIFAQYDIPHSKVHGANMGPIWGRQGPGWPHIGQRTFLSGMA